MGIMSLIIKRVIVYLCGWNNVFMFYPDRNTHTHTHTYWYDVFLCTYLSEFLKRGVGWQSVLLYGNEIFKLTEPSIAVAHSLLY